MAKQVYWVTITREEIMEAMREQIEEMTLWDCVKNYPWYIWVGMCKLMRGKNPIDYWGGLLWYPGRLNTALRWRFEHPMEDTE